MAWQTSGKCRSYRRTRRVRGRLVCTYEGSGLAGELAAARHARERERRDAERAERAAERARLDAIDAARREEYDLVQGIAEAALVLAGCRYRNREWRKPRGK